MVQIAQYGLQTEIPRWQVLLFWLFMLLGLSPLATSLARKVPAKRVVQSISLLLAGSFLVLSYMPASLYRLNDNWDSSGFLDRNYYYEHASELLKQDVESPNYRIADYNLSVELKRQLSVVASLHLVADVPRQSFVFTLYHGYHRFFGQSG